MTTPEIKSILQALAKEYRKMPYGGAVLLLHKWNQSPESHWCLSDGYCVKASSPHKHIIIRELTALGWKEIAEGQYKLICDNRPDFMAQALNEGNGAYKP